jgi:hypothetical protein
VSNELALYAGIALLMLGAVIYVAHRRGRSPIGWFLLSFVIPPPLTLLMLFALPVPGQPVTPARRALATGVIVAVVAVVLGLIWALGYEF